MNIGEKVKHLSSSRIGIISAYSESCPTHIIVKFADLEEIVSLDSVESSLEVLNNHKVNPLEIESALNSYLLDSKIGRSASNILGNRNTLVHVAWISSIDKMELTFDNNQVSKSSAEDCLNILLELEDTFS